MKFYTLPPGVVSSIWCSWWNSPQHSLQSCVLGTNPACSYIFSVLAVKAICWVQNFKNIEKKCCWTVGPINNMSLNEGHKRFLHSYKTFPSVWWCWYGVGISGNESGKFFLCLHFHYRQILVAFAQALHFPLCSLHNSSTRLVGAKDIFQTAEIYTILGHIICQIPHDHTSMVTAWQISQCHLMYCLTGNDSDIPTSV